MRVFMVIIFLLAVDGGYGDAITGNDDHRVVCYFTNWAQYRPGDGSFKAVQIDPFLCTHVVVAFAKLTTDGITTFEWNDLEMYGVLHDRKKQNPALKTLLSIGGANVGSGPFAEICQSAEKVAVFAGNVASFLRQHDFNGLDVDWEFPEQMAGNFTLLLKGLQEEFQSESVRSGSPRLLLSAALTPGIGTAANSYDIPAVAQYVDFVNVMAYDYHGIWQHPMRTALHTALFPSSPTDTLSVENTLSYYLGQGMPPGQINLGVALYGRGWVLKEGASREVGVIADGPSPAQKYSRQQSIVAYNEMCGEGWTRQVHPVQKAAYAYKDDIWVGYDSMESLAVKVSYLKNQSFGGVMFWAMGYDDFGNWCGEGSFPLIRSARRALGLDNQVSTTPSTTTTKPTNVPTTPSTTTTTPTNVPTTPTTTTSKTTNVPTTLSTTTTTPTNVPTTPSTTTATPTNVPTTPTTTTSKTTNVPTTPSTPSSNRPPIDGGATNHAPGRHSTPRSLLSLLITTGLITRAMLVV